MSKEITRHVHIFPGASGKIAVGIRRKLIDNKVYYPREKSRFRLQRILESSKPLAISLDRDGPTLYYQIEKTLAPKGQLPLQFTPRRHEARPLKVA